MKVRLGNEIELECQVCGEDEFSRRSVQLNTALMTVVGLDGANRSADCFVCSRCGYIHWFLPKDAEIQTLPEKPRSDEGESWTPPI